MELCTKVVPFKLLSALTKFDSAFF